MLLTHVHASTVPTCTAPVGTLSSTHTVGFAVDPMTTCDSTALDDEALPASPAYRAEIACVPIASALVAHVAVRVLPVPLTPRRRSPLIVAGIGDATVAVGALPVSSR